MLLIALYIRYAALSTAYMRSIVPCFLVKASGTEPRFLKQHKTSISKEAVQSKRNLRPKAWQILQKK